MTYRTQATVVTSKEEEEEEDARRAMVSELLRENRRLRQENAVLADKNNRLQAGRLTLSELLKNVGSAVALAVVILSLPVYLIVDYCVRVRTDTECQYQCAKQSGTCVTSAPSGFVCEGGANRNVAPRSGQ